jgi:hypothetical protein
MEINCKKVLLLHDILSIYFELVETVTILQAEMSRVRVPMSLLNFFLIYLILPAALGLEVYSTSNRNEYRK